MFLDPSPSFPSQYFGSFWLLSHIRNNTSNIFFAYLSYLTGTQFHLIRSISSLNYYSTIICLASNSYFHSCFHSGPRVQIQKFDYVIPLLAVDHWHLITHSIKNWKSFGCLENTYSCFMFLWEVFQNKFKCVILICHSTLWINEFSKLYCICFFASLILHLFKYLESKIPLSQLCTNSI